MRRLSHSKGPMLGRRRVLAGASSVIGLPFLEAMLGGRVARASESGIPGRVAFCHYGTGMNMREFEPIGEGRDFQLSRTLRPLERHREEMTVLSGTWLKHGGGHTGDYTFLTGAEAYKGGRIQNTLSADQQIVEMLKPQTRFPSLQLSVRRGTNFGNQGLATLSWNTNGIPLAAESDPHRVFKQLFQVDSPDEGDRRAEEFRLRGSVLDSVMGEARSLERVISGRDKEKLDEYFTSVREVEKQLERNRAWANKPKPEPHLEGLGDYTHPSGPDDVDQSEFVYAEYSRMMFDLIALAFQTDSTRVISYNIRRELAGGVFPEMGVNEGYHTMTHHNNDPRRLEDWAKVDTIYMGHWAYFLDRMTEIKEVDGSPLLDHCMLAFSSGMGIGHSKTRLPSAVFGGRALGVQHQGHLVLPEQTPLAGLWHTMANRVGAAAPDGKFQDSAGVIDELIGA